MNQRGRLEHLALASHLSMRKPPQLIINKRQQPIDDVTLRTSR
jgi:hypothetical protein